MKDQKIIVNIGRQIGSGGRIIARQLAEVLNCAFYDRELLNLAAKESGFSEKFFEQNDEKKGFLHTPFHVNIPLMGENNFYKNDFSQESLYQFQSDAITKAAREGNCVFVGRTADYVLREFPNTVNIFITAKLEDRIQRVAERQHVSEEDARKYISAREAARAIYYNYYTGKKWGASESYDLCVNSSILGLDETVEFITSFIKRRFKQ